MIPRRKIYTVDDEVNRLVKEIFKKSNESTNWISKFEHEFARFIGVKYAITVASGRKGMELILKALELNKGDEVIIPAYTLKDLIGVIHSLGLVAVPADVSQQTFNIDPEAVLKEITDRTKVILATHLFGVPCQIDRILEIAKDNSIIVIEDCAHSVGSEFKGNKTGAFGDAAFFSFDTIKPVNTYGGGMVVTNSEELANRMRKEKPGPGNSRKVPIKKIVSALIEKRFLPTLASFPLLYLLASPHWNKKIYNLYRKMQSFSATQYVFTDFQAHIGLEKLKTLKERISYRQKQAVFLKSLLNKRIIPQKLGNGSFSNYYFFVSLIPSNIWKVRKFLLNHGIDAGIGPEIADDCSSVLGYTDCPNAKRVFHQAIQLPLYEGLSQNEIDYIANVLNKIS